MAADTQNRALPEGLTHSTCCSYEMRMPFKATRRCRQYARWLVEYTAPDDGKNMRYRVAVVRCLAHTESRFLPKGATGITTSLVEDSRAARSPAPSER